MTFCYRLPAALLSMVIIATACEPGGASPSGPITPPSADASAGGATVFRGQRTQFVAHFDQARQLLSIHAPSNLCTDGSFSIDDVQFVTTPSAIDQFIAQVKSDDEPVAVYHAASFADAGMAGTVDLAGYPGGIVDVGQFCGFLTGPNLIAEGVVHRVSVLSNASFTATWSGRLATPGGIAVGLTEKYQLGGDAHDPNNSASWVVHVSQILLH